jgi:phage terminase large subunit-like protein
MEKTKKKKTSGLTSTNHSKSAHQYARDILAEKIPSCRWVKKACERHLSDLRNSHRVDFPYEYNPEKGDRVCRFIENLPHTAGEWAARKEKIRLEPWQKFIVCSLFGWVKKTNGLRRFRKAYICVPRKNAKSTLAAGIGLYCLIADGEHGGQVYAGATGEKQAGFVFDPACEMARKSQRMIDRFGVEVMAKSITVENTNSKFTVLIGKPDDGGSPSLAIIDEYHEHLDATLYDTMVTGMGARRQPLALVITTAGTDTGGPCYTLQREMEQMLLGVYEKPDVFAIIYSIDSEAYTDTNGVFHPADDWKTEEALIKANPNWGVSVYPEGILSEQRDAIQSAEKQNIFKTKHMDVWCNARASWINMERWSVLADPTLKEDDFKGEPCVIGLDLASMIDMAAAVKVFKRVHEDGTEHYYIFPRFYLPEERANMSEFQHYQAWVHQGHLIATPGSEIDLLLIKKNILSDIAKFSVKELAFDPHQALMLKQELEAEAASLSAVNVPQNALVLTVPMRMLEGIIQSGRVHHDGNPVMTWMLSNVVVKPDANENIYPRKEKPEKKIDGVTALLNALCRVPGAFATMGKIVFKYTGL